MTAVAPESRQYFVPVISSVYCSGRHSLICLPIPFFSVSVPVRIPSGQFHCRGNLVRFGYPDMSDHRDTLCLQGRSVFQSDGDADCAGIRIVTIVPPQSRLLIVSSPLHIILSLSRIFASAICGSSSSVGL